MRILFVRPRPSPETIGLQHVMVVEPLELEILSALCRPGDHRMLADLILEKKPLSAFLEAYRPDVVCITAYITHVSIVTGYCREIKRGYPGVATVVGGVHCEVCPGDFDDPAVDFRAVRNAALLFPALLGHLETGSPLPEGILRPGELPAAEQLPPFDFRIPLPDRGLTAPYRNRYFYIFHDRVALLKTSFGCPHHCSFCFCTRITRGIYAQRPLPEVMEELETLSEREIYIVDDDFLADRRRLLEFIGECRSRDIRKHYLVYGRADFIAGNPDLLRSFRDAGLKTVIVGLESFEEADLNLYNKHTTPAVNIRAMEILNSLGIDCFATLIVPPHWGREEFRAMTRRLVGLGVHFVNLQPLTPLPGAGMAFPPSRMILDRQDFEKWDLAHQALQPEKLSVAGFYREMVKAYYKIIFQPRFLVRHLVRYPLPLLARMVRGAFLVSRQYRQKIKEAERHA